MLVRFGTFLHTPIRKQIVKEQKGQAYQTQTTPKQDAQVVIPENWANGNAMYALQRCSHV